MLRRALLLPLLGTSVCLAQNAGSGPAPDSKKLGDFLIEPERNSDTCGIESKYGGHRAYITQRIFYRDRLLTAVASAPVVSSHDPSRLIFSVSPACLSDQIT